jgi:Na+/melibiose symporter-like transporter
MSTLTARTRRGYALGGVATGAFGTVPGLMLLPYLTERLAVPAAIAGVIVFAPKAWDVILNPIAGRISDRSTHPAGPRRLFLIRAGLLLALAFALLFAGPTQPIGLAAAWVTLLFLACATAYAFFQVPYVAMPAELTDDPAERTGIMTWRVAVLSLAILVSGGLAPVVRNSVGPEHGYAAMGVFVAALIALGALGAWWGTRDAPVARAHAAAGGLRTQLGLVAADRNFRALLLTFVVQALATGAMLAGVDYVARQVLHDKGAGSILFVCFVAPAIICTPVPGSGLPPASARNRHTSLPASCSPPAPWPCRRHAPYRPPRSTSRSRWSGSGMPGPRCSRWPCFPTWLPPMRSAPARVGWGSSPASGRPGRPWGWPSGRLCSGSSWPPGAMSRPAIPRPLNRTLR